MLAEELPSTGGIAQLVERLVRNEKARGSNPLTSSLSCAIEESEGCHASAFTGANDDISNPLLAPLLHNWIW